MSARTSASPCALVDGTVYGSLCCISAQPTPALSDRDARLLDVLARIIADQIDTRAPAAPRRALEGEATAGQALLAALKARERYTAEHSEAVVALATAVARELGLPTTRSCRSSQVALLHDIGKLGVPEAILQKPGALTDEEWRIMRAHPRSASGSSPRSPSSPTSPPRSAPSTSAGTAPATPTASPATEIPLASRICLACDAWHAMRRTARTAPRCPRRRRAPSCSAQPARQFCPRTVEALLAVLDAARRPAPRTVALPEPAAQPESELRALIAVAGAVAAAHRLEDVLEVVAEETRRVVGASSVSISRWEREHDRVRTLINVGELGPGEERFPTDETYALADYPLAARLLRDGTSYVISSGDPDLGRPRQAAAGRARQGLLHRRAGDLRRPHVGQARGVRQRRRRAVHAPPRAVPGGDRRPGRRRDRPRRAVLHVNALAYLDPLTGLATGARSTSASSGPSTRRPAGDRVLRPRRPQADQRLARPRRRRPRDPARRRRARRRRAGRRRRLRLPRRRRRVLRRGRGRRRRGGRRRRRRGGRASGGEPLALSCGVAELRQGARPADLFRAADSAQYARDGGGRVVIAEGELACPAARLGASLATAPTPRRVRWPSGCST